MLASAAVKVLVMPLAATTDAVPAAVLAARFADKIKVDPSRICAIVVPGVIPAPEMGCPTTKPDVVPEERVTIAVAVVPVAARLIELAIP